MGTCECNRTPFIDRLVSPIVLEIIKFKNSAIWLAKSIFALNHAHLKLHDQFVVLTDMKLHLHNQFITLINKKLHAKNQLYTFLSFWDFKALIPSLGMNGHNWSCPPKITLLICSFNRYVPAYKKSTLYLQ